MYSRMFDGVQPRSNARRSCGEAALDETTRLFSPSDPPTAASKLNFGPGRELSERLVEPKKIACYFPSISLARLMDIAP